MKKTTTLLLSILIMGCAQKNDESNNNVTKHVHIKNTDICFSYVTFKDQFTDELLSFRKLCEGSKYKTTDFYTENKLEQKQILIEGFVVKSASDIDITRTKGIYYNYNDNSCYFKDVSILKDDNISYSKEKISCDRMLDDVLK